MGHLKTTPEAKTLDQMIACAEREVKFRERVYEGRINKLAMKIPEAQHELDTMKRILEYLKEQDRKNKGVQQALF